MLDRREEGEGAKLEANIISREKSETKLEEQDAEADAASGL